MFDDLVRLYESGERTQRIQADRQIRKRASGFDLSSLLELLQRSSSSLHARMAAAMAIGYHQQSGSAELRVLFKALEQSKGEPTAYAYRILSAIRQLLSRDVGFPGMDQFYGAVNHYRVAGGKDTKTAASVVAELMRQAERTFELALPLPPPRAVAGGEQPKGLSALRRFVGSSQPLPHSTRTCKQKFSKFR
jgi:hypothetical protein